MLQFLIAEYVLIYCVKTGRYIGGDSSGHCSGHYCLRHVIRRLCSLHSQVWCVICSSFL